MERPNVTLRRVARTVGYLLVGAVGTVAVALGLLYATGPVRVLLYDAFYRSLGPWGATTAATVLQFTVVLVVAVAVPTVVGEYLGTGTEHLRALCGGFAALVALVVVGLVAAAVAGLVGFATALVAVAAVAVVVPLGFRRLGTLSGGVTAFAGGLPAVFLGLLLLGFGLGWGGGYDLTARAVDASAVGDRPSADFSGAPEVREDLFAPTSCDPYDDGVCRLPLRGYEHEASAGRFLDRHGARCPYLNAPRGYDPPGNRSFFARHDGTYYRVQCVAYGD